MGLPPVAIAAGISGLFSAFGQGAANKENRDLSNTAYQRAMADMKKAGLNPMLAYQKGGASTPDMKSVTKDLPQSIASAVQATRAKSEIDNLKSQTALNDQNKNLSEANTALTLEQANSERAKQGLSISQTELTAIHAGLAKFEAETRRIGAGATVSKEVKSFGALVQKTFNLPEDWGIPKIMNWARTNVPHKTGNRKLPPARPGTLKLTVTK